MADNNRYEIIIKNETDDEDGNPIAGSENGKKGGKSKEGKGAKWAKNAVKGLVAYNTYVKPFVSATAGHYISTVSLKTGSEELQQRLQFAYNVAEEVVGIGASIVAGFAVGNVAGAVVGAVIGIATTALNYANRAETINMTKSLEDISLRGMNVRAGGGVSSFSGSRADKQ